MRRALRQLLWIWTVWAVKVEARLTVTQEEKESGWVNPYYDLCEQIQCLRVEDIFNLTVNLHENPCDDYYRYACSRPYTPFVDHHPFSVDADQVFKDLEGILKEELTRTLEQGNEALAVERNIFKKCLDGTAYSDQERDHYVNHVLLNSGANRLFSQYTYESHQAKHWDEVDLKYAMKGFGFTFFDVEIYQDTNGGYRGGHSSGSKRYILIKPPFYDVSKISKLLSLYFDNKHGSSHASYRKNSKYTRLEEFIAAISGVLATVQIDAQKQTKADIQLLRISEWQRLYSAHANKNAEIDWLNCLTKLFQAVKVNVPLRSDTVIAVQHQNYFKELAKTLKDTPENDAIVDYVHLHFVSKTVGLADPNYKEYSMLPQYLGMTCTPGLMVGAAYRYAEEHFPEENRKLLEDLLLKVKNTVVARVQNVIRSVSQFSTDNTKSLLEQFVTDYQHARVYAGYPDWLLNGTDVYSIYGRIHMNQYGQSFYEYQTSVIEHLLRAKLLRLESPNSPIIDLTELRKGFESNKIKIQRKSGVEHEDAYSLSEKEIVVPFGYFNEKDYRFLSSQLFDPINYGAAATEVAFQLYWELLQSIDYLTIAPKCITDLVPSRITNKDEFLKRAVAYLLALEAAHTAWPSKNSYPIQFVDFGAVSDSDAFFLSFAKSLCTIPPRLNVENEKPSETHYRINEDALPDYINFALRNFKPFSDNYMCQKNHTIDNDKKCDPLDFNKY